MTDWFAVTGWVMSLVSLGGNVWQGFRQWVNKRLNDERRSRLEAIRASLVQTRTYCTEAANKGEIIKSSAEHLFVSGVGHQIKQIEHQVEAMLEVMYPQIRNRYWLWVLRKLGW